MTRLLTLGLLALWTAGAGAQTPADSLGRPQRPDSTAAVPRFRRIPPPDSSSAPRPFARRIDSTRVVDPSTSEVVPSAAAPAAAPSGDRRHPLPQTALFVGNTVAGTLLTTARGAIEGVPARRLPAVALGGAASGAGFWAAKRLLGQRQTVAGFAVAYASASLAENVAEGRHALSHVRLGLGPLDLRIATGIGRRDDTPAVRLEVDPLSVAAAVTLPLSGFRLRPCRAGLCYRSGEPVLFERGGRRFRRVGRTIGRVVRVWAPLTERTEAHEGIHVIQGMQLVAATPRGTVREIGGWTGHAPGDAGVTLDARLDWLSPLVGGAVFALVPYERLWTEREAVTMAGRE